MYTNFKELHKAYGFNNGERTRDNLSHEEEKNFVKDCFEIYEHIGFAETFGTPYTGEKHLVGKKFAVLNRVKELSEDSNGADLECLPMWNIRFEDGFEMAAYPEEICLAERNCQ